MNFRRHTSAFSFVEVLIVIGILVILATMAVPKFMIAQVRAKLSQNLTDMKYISESLEAYRLDHKVYPPWRQARAWVNVDDHMHPLVIRYYRLTTPVAYIGQVPIDPFVNYEDEAELEQWGDAYDYVEVTNGDNEVDPDAWGHQFRINGWGPDGVNSYAGGREFNNAAEGCPAGSPLFVYNPTNGLVSYGDILWVGPKGGPFIDSYCEIINGY
ncbi:MAG: hypothetical protein P9L94_05435 [Candidatus Hinthialibacter antarcticus]|nr:hypothetical protein [Candidatus Hinthialibacter antarcticus]